MRGMNYIHQQAGWPAFTWSDPALAAALVRVRHEQGRLLGQMEGLGFELRSEASLTMLTSDVIKSSSIEGEELDSDEVRSSIARRLGLDAGGVPNASRDVEGIVEMMLDATRGFEEPLTQERLFAWHAALFPTGRSGMTTIRVGAWRTAESGPMQVVSGAIGSETVHFEAPEAGRLSREMDLFLEWFNAPARIDPVLKAGLTHLWFVTIHPFDDGNGRIARAIADMALARADGTRDRFYSMSTQIERERKVYYRNLELTQRGTLDITPWHSWFLDCLGRAIHSAAHELKSVLHKSRFWQRASAHSLNARQGAVITRMLSGFDGFMSTSKYAKLAKCSTDTALRDLQDLVRHRILVQNLSGGRSTSYRLADMSDRLHD